MIRLVRVELTRLRWRRAVLLLVLAAVVVPALVMGARVFDTRPIGAAERARAEQLVEEQRVFIQRDIERCLRRPGQFGLSTENAERRCPRIFGGGLRAEDFYGRQPLRLGRERGEGGLAVVAVLGILMLLAGTTFVGHDWSSGSMSNQLLFEPRRLRVWSAKAVAVALTALVVGAVGLGVFWGGLTVAAYTRDLDPTGQAFTDVAQQAGRGLLLVVGAAFGGYALTTLVRSTVFTVGVLLGVAVAGGLLFGALLPEGAQRFEPATNAVALVNGQAEYYVQPPDACFAQAGTPEGLDCDGTERLRQGPAAVYWAVLLGALGAGSAASYRRRDVP